MNHDPRRGFRLIDLMTAIFVISLLFALVRLVNSTREAGRRTQCQNNLRQLGLGLLGYSNAHNYFPNAGTIFDDPAVHHGDPTASNLYLAVVDPAALARKPGACLHSWVVDIIPNLDYQGLSTIWNRQLAFDSTSAPAGELSNREFSSFGIGILRCPDDPTYVPNQGNLSYAVNGGFARWPAIPVGWTGSAIDGRSTNGGVLQWTSPGRPWQETQEIGRKLGVMFLGTQSGDQPWDYRTSQSRITDGASATLLIGENTLVGVSRGTPYSGGMPTNWACPLPNFTMFLGSDDVCRSSRSPTDCLGGQLAPSSRPEADGPGWARANARGTFENINSGWGFAVEGSSPFANSGHPGGSNFVFCDGATRFLSETIDGTVYAKILTPAGGQLPETIKQRSVRPDDYAQ